MDDVARLRVALAEVEVSARALRWAPQRPWRAATHVVWSTDLPEVDLHDLDARHARAVVRVAAALPTETGAVRFVTGRGRHTTGPGGILGPVVRDELRKAMTDQPWTLRPAGPARWVLITDASRAPASATGRLGWGFLLLMIGLALAAIVAVGHALGHV